MINVKTGDWNGHVAQVQVSDAYATPEGWVKNNEEWKQVQVKEPPAPVALRVRLIPPATKNQAIQLNATNPFDLELWENGVLKSTQAIDGASTLNVAVTAGVPSEIVFKGELKVKANSSTDRLEFATDNGITEIVEINDDLYQFKSYPAMHSNKLVKVPDNVPPSIDSLYFAFIGCSIFNQPLDKWDTSRITRASFAFSNALLYNQNLTTWDVTKVTNWTGFYQGSGLALSNVPVKFR